MAPSAELATAFQLSLGTLLLAQLAPAFVEVKMPPSDAAATRFAPSAEEAMAVQELWGALVFVQLWAEARQAAMEGTITARASRLFMVVILA